MTTETYTTVAFEVELLPDKAVCYFCDQIYGNKIAGLLPYYFSVRNMDGSRTLVSCGMHLETVTTMWDHLMAELDEARPPDTIYSSLGIAHRPNEARRFA